MFEGEEQLGKTLSSIVWLYTHICIHTYIPHTHAYTNTNTHTKISFSFTQENNILTLYKSTAKFIGTGSLASFHLIIKYTETTKSPHTECEMRVNY